MKVVGYARIRLSENGRDLSLQLNALTNAGCSQIFKDEVFGPHPLTPEWDKVLSSLNPGDRLIVWKLDRISRSLQQLVHIVNTLQLRSIELISLTEGIDTSRTEGWSIGQLFAMLEQFELGLAQERARRGLACAILMNRTIGRRPVITQKKFDHALQFISQGMSVREVAAKLSVSKTALYDAIRRRKRASSDAHLKVADMADLVVLEPSAVCGAHESTEAFSIARPAGDEC